MNFNVPIVHVHTSSKDTAVNGIGDPKTGKVIGIVIFDIQTSGHPKVFIHWSDHAMRRQLLYALMTTEELERFTAR